MVDEAEEIDCVLAKIQEFLYCENDSFAIFTPFYSQGCPRFQVQKGGVSTIREKTTRWKFEEPKLPEKNSPLRKSIFRCNTSLASSFASYWLGDDYLLVYDYIGFYVWDFNQLAYVHFTTLVTGATSPETHRWYCR
jgi:hypothetical protein